MRVRAFLEVLAPLGFRGAPVAAGYFCAIGVLGLGGGGFRQEAATAGAAGVLVELEGEDQVLLFAVPLRFGARRDGAAFVVVLVDRDRLPAVESAGADSEGSGCPDSGAVLG